MKSTVIIAMRVIALRNSKYQVTLNTRNGADVQAPNFQGTPQHYTAKTRILFPEFKATYTQPTTRLVKEV